MKRFSEVLGLVFLMTILPARSGLLGDTPASDPQPAGKPKPALEKRSGNPALEVAREKWDLPAAPRPEARILSPDQKAALPPPQSVYIHRPSSGETRLDPPPAVPVAHPGEPVVASGPAVPIHSAQPTMIGVQGNPTAAEPPQAAGDPKSALERRSGSPSLEVAREKWALKAIRRPKQRVLTAEQEATLPPPDWVYTYCPSTGEIRLDPPPALPDALKMLATNAVPSSYGLLGRSPHPLVVIGTDDRQRVTPTTDFPWRVIGKLYMRFPNDVWYVGSGALIDPFHVLTAGHNVHSVEDGGWATDLEFIPGMDGNYAPFSSAWDVDVRSPSGWTDQQDPEYDWGLITLDRNIGAILGWLGYASEDLTYYPGRTFNLAGYPDDRDQGLGLYWAYDVATRATENELYHVIDSAAGQSGSPIWRYIEATDQSHIMAVHTYGDVTENSGSRINPSRVNSIWTWSNEDPRPLDQPDLIDDGTDYSGFSPTAVASGGQFHVFCDVQNIGTTTSLGFTVAFYASPDATITTADYPIGTVDVPYLESFTYVDCDWVGPFPATIPMGTYSVGWIIDVYDQVYEFNESDNAVVHPTPLIVGALPNIQVLSGDFNPASPIQVAPGQSVAFTTNLTNTGGSGTAPFWFEFWGSRTGGFMYDLFLCDSARPGPLNPGQLLPLSHVVPLASIPEGPYTVIMVADRPNEIQETNEQDNRIVVGGKRLLVIRPQTNADMAVQGFSFWPNPVYTGQAINLGGTVRNTGTQNTGPFWIEFWGSYDRLYPSTDFMLCDSIGVVNMAPGQVIDLSQYPRTLYNTPPGTFMVGVVVDRLDQVSERDETNNYLFLDGYRLNQASPAPSEENAGIVEEQLPDLVVTIGDFAPFSPQQSLPFSPLTIWTQIANNSSYPTGPFWVEFWGSRTGGLTLDEMVADSAYVGGLGAWGVLDLALPRFLYSIPDGPYSVVAVVDRPGWIAEANEGNNRLAVAGKRILTIRPQTLANLVPESFAVPTSMLYRGQPLSMSGLVRNIGSQNSGPFWIEFFVTVTPPQPALDSYLCESIHVPDLPAGAAIDLASYPRQLYPWVPLGPVSVICFPDRNDLVNETHEEDNYVVLSGYTISP